MVRTIKFAAHPLVVAVAMGFLSPAVLEEQVEVSRADLITAGDADALVASLDDLAPTAEDFARVESVWRSVTLG